MVLLVMLGVSHFAQAQWDTLALPFRSITIEDGLSQGMVNTIIQDRYGFMSVSYTHLTLPTSDLV